MPLKHTFGFFESFTKITYQLEFHITFKTADLQGFACTTLSNDITVTINNLKLFVWTYLSDSGTKLIFNDPIKNSFTLSFDSWTTDSNVVDNGVEFQIDIGSAHKTVGPKNLTAANLSIDRIGVGSKPEKMAFFDIIGLRKGFVILMVFDIPGILKVSNMI